MIANGARETSYVWIVVIILDTIIRKYRLLYIALLQAEAALAHCLFFKFLICRNRNNLYNTAVRLQLILLSKDIGAFLI